MYDITADSLLSEEFLEPRQKLNPKHIGKTGKATYCRTYQRKRTELSRRETWAETVQRVVEYSMSLYQGPAKREDLVAEAEDLYDRIFHMKLFPSGRVMWLGGTEAIKKVPEAAFNCAFLTIKNYEDICEDFHLLLCGCGVGDRILLADLVDFPKVYSVGKTINHMQYNHIKGGRNPDETEVDYLSGYNNPIIRVGDSKEGWVSALRYLFLYMTMPGQCNITFNYDWVRPKGEPLKTFGGYAPGPEGLTAMLVNITAKLLRFDGQVPDPLTIGDICCYLGKNSIVGGNRRASKILLFDPDNNEFIMCKAEDNWEPQRIMSNNSMIFQERPTKEKLASVFEFIKHNGEPGFYNLEAARKRHPYAQGTNPCGEILLADKGFCNLSTVVVSSHVNEFGVLNWDDLKRSFELATRIGMRQTNVTVTLPEWDEIQKRDRLCGVSMTGVMDAGGLEDYELNELRDVCHDEADTYAYEMRIPRPLLVTCVKPEGTLSLLPTVSPGLHRARAPYYIRRIRMSDIEPTAKALIKKGVRHVQDPEKPERIIFEFPLTGNTNIIADEEPAKEQLKRYLSFMRNYVDHNASNTIYVGPDEYPGIIDMVHENWNDIVGVAWLPKYMSEQEDNPYPFLPEEPISKEEYERRDAEFPNLDDLEDLINEIENGNFFEEVELVDDTCKNGSCPVR